MRAQTVPSSPVVAGGSPVLNIPSQAWKIRNRIQNLSVSTSVCSEKTVVPQQHVAFTVSAHPTPHKVQYAPRTLQPALCVTDLDDTCGHDHQPQPRPGRARHPDSMFNPVYALSIVSYNHLPCEYVFGQNEEDGPGRVPYGVGGVFA